MIPPRPFDDNAIKLRGDQWSLPKNLSYLADYYPTLPWVKAQQLWTETVSEILKKYGINHIGDLPYGRGYNESSVTFIKKLNEWRDNR